MAKPGPKPNRKEISIYLEDDYCPSRIYGKKENDKYVFTDIRTTVNFLVYKEYVEDCEDFTENDIDACERWKRYKSAKIFDADYNLTARKSYDFKVMRDLYSVLWNSEQENVLNSGETLVSPNKALYRAREIAEKDKCDFLYSIAIIGNFLPVPSSNQLFLKGLEERFDRELNLIKACYYLKYNGEYDNDFIPDTVHKWLDLYKSWKDFVDRNYLNGSFVDDKYNVVQFGGSLCQLSLIIYKRSVVMIKEYEKKVGAKS